MDGSKMPIKAPRVCRINEDTFANELMGNVNESVESCVFDQQHTTDEHVEDGHAIRNALVRYCHTIDIESVL